MIYKGKTVRSAIKQAVRGRRTTETVDYAACRAQSGRFESDFRNFIERAQSVERLQGRLVHARHFQRRAQSGQAQWEDIELDSAIADAFTPRFGNLRSLINATDRGRFRPNGDGTQVTSIVGLLEAAVFPSRRATFFRDASERWSGRAETLVEQLAEESERARTAQQRAIASGRALNQCYLRNLRMTTELSR